MTRKSLSLVASVGLVALLYAPRASAQTSPSLGAAATYSILAGSAVTNTGATTISGDVGISPGIGPVPHFTGFGTVTLGGTVNDANGAAAAAQFDRDIAKLALDGQGCTVSYPDASKELGGLTLVPGVYCAHRFHLSGPLTLNGTAADTWIFKSEADLIIDGGAPAKVVSPSCNVWWRAVSAATYDAGSSLIGNILADTAITMAPGASLTGRALAHAEVTLSSNTINACTAPVPTLPEWAFIMLAVLLAAAGAVALRRRTLA